MLLWRGKVCWFHWRENPNGSCRYGRPLLGWYVSQWLDRSVVSDMSTQKLLVSLMRLKRSVLRVARRREARNWTKISSWAPSSSFMMSTCLTSFKARSQTSTNQRRSQSRTSYQTNPKSESLAQDSYSYQGTSCAISLSVYVSGNSLILILCSLRRIYLLYDNWCDCVPSVSSRTCLTIISRTRRSAVWYVYLLINTRRLCELVCRSWSR